MRKFSILLVVSILCVWGCSTVPFTNRKQGRLLPENMLASMALTEYQSFLSENQLSKNATQTEMVKTVGENIKQAVIRFYTQTGRAKELANYRWEFNLVESPDVNAWCMPGGKVVVYTGLLPVAQDADGLAVVMGHEIAHALAHHGNERMSQGLVAQMGGVALQVATANQPAQTRNLFMQAYGIGAQVGALLPFSRLQESEADEIGLYLMAIAGYNPEKSVDFWKRMAAHGGGKVPAFLSTHPDDSKRAANLKALIPKVKATAQKYK